MQECIRTDLRRATTLNAKTLSLCVGGGTDMTIDIELAISTPEHYGIKTTDAREMA